MLYLPQDLPPASVSPTTYLQYGSQSHYEPVHDLGFPDFMMEQGFPSRQGIDVRTGSTGLGLFFSRMAAGLHERGGVRGSTSLSNGGRFGGGRFVITLP